MCRVKDPGVLKLPVFKDHVLGLCGVPIGRVMTGTMVYLNGDLMATAEVVAAARDGRTDFSLWRGESGI